MKIPFPGIKDLLRKIVSLLINEEWIIQNNGNRQVNVTAAKSMNNNRF